MPTGDEADPAVPPTDQPARPAARHRHFSLGVEASLVAALIVLAWRLKWIADDGYIYLTHVQNWVENGHGPNLNAGERVEGYTSVAWLAVLAFADLVRPDRWWTLEQVTVLISLGMTALTASTWILAERAAVRTASPTKDTDVAVINLPLVLFASSYVVRSYATSGLETPMIMWWVVTVVWMIWRPHRSVLALAALAGVGPLVRPDLALVSLGLIGIVLFDWLRARRRAAPWEPHITIGAIALILVPGLLSELIRIAYYGQLLPNTYYAKTGTPHGWGDGWHYLRDAAGPHRWWWIAALALAATIAPALARRRRGEKLRVDTVDLRRLWLLGASLVMAVSAIRVGGDFMHGRTLIPTLLFLIGALSGAATTALALLKRPRWQVQATAVAVLATVFALQVPTTSRQYATGQLVIDGIADELRFYELRDPNMHDFGAKNLNPLAARGRDLAALADRLGTEVGASSGSIGMTSYFGQRGGGQVYVYDVLGLTQPEAARVEPAATGTRVGHSHRATEPMVVSNPRVDFSELSLPGYDDAFRVQVGTSWFVLIDLGLIEPLRTSGIIGDADVARMRTYVEHTIANPDVDPDVATFITWRYLVDLRPSEFAVTGPERDWYELVRTSPWGSWMGANSAALAELDVHECGGLIDCLRHAIEAHRAEPIPFLPPGALAPPGCAIVEPQGTETSTAQAVPDVAYPAASTDSKNATTPGSVVSATWAT